MTERRIFGPFGYHSNKLCMRRSDSTRSTDIEDGYMPILDGRSYLECQVAVSSMRSMT